jgi:hypothetical protein
MENPFVHSKAKIQELEQSNVFVDDGDAKFSVATLDINEGE